MTKLFTAFMEMIRMMFWFFLLTALFGELEKQLYTLFLPWREWFGMLLLGGNGLLFFVLYRNRWQFKGWYRSATTQLKLRRSVTTGCVATAVLLISSPIFLFWI